MDSSTRTPPRRSASGGGGGGLEIGAALAASVEGYDDRMDFIRLTAYSHGSG